MTIPQGLFRSGGDGRYGAASAADQGPAPAGRSDEWFERSVIASATAPATRATPASTAARSPADPQPPTYVRSGSATAWMPSSRSTVSGIGVGAPVSGSEPLETFGNAVT